MKKKLDDPIKRRRFNLKTKEIPVTQKMLYGVRDELMSRLSSHDNRFTSIEKRLDSIDERFESIDRRFDSIDKRFESMEARFDSIDKRFESMEARFDSIDKRFESMEARFDSIDKRFESMEARFDSIDRKFESIDKRFDSIDRKFEALDAKIDSKFDLLLAEIRRVGIIVEEQRAQNIYVLDGISNLSARMEKVEERLDILEDDWAAHKPLIRK